MEDLETLFCKSNDFNVPNINKDFPYGSPEENILFFKDVTPPEVRNVKNSMQWFYQLKPYPPNYAYDYSYYSSLKII